MDDRFARFPSMQHAPGAWLSSYSPGGLLVVAVTSDSSYLEWQGGQNHNSVTVET